MEARSSSPTSPLHGPIIMIVIGSLFLLGQTTPYGLSRTWPLLIIAVGILKLVDRVTASSTGGNP